MSIIRSKMLIMFATKANSNKFYEIQLDDVGNVTARYGRVGTAGRTLQYVGGDRKYEQLLREKQRKGYKEALLDDSVEEGDKTAAIDGKMMKMKTNVIDIALKQINYCDDESKTLIQDLSKENIHTITKRTSIKYDYGSGLFKTPLGVISKVGVEKAVEILDQIEKLLPDEEKNEEELLRLNEEYFVIIPNHVPNAREKKFLIFEQANLDKQRDICDALFNTLELIDDLKKGESGLKKEAESQDVEQVFDVEIKLVRDEKEIQPICDYYKKTLNPLHGGKIMQSFVSNVFSVKLGSQQEVFETTSKEIGNVEKLWHGTRVGNILSIMGKGLLMPSQSPGQKAGAMFGNGLYFANQSSKSLQYCDGLFWANGTNTRDKIYMFLASVAMGKYQTPTGSTGKPPKKPYNSYWAKAGVSGVLNDEIIVFKGNQVRLDYLVEVTLPQ